MTKPISGTEIALRSLPLMGVGLIMAIMTQMTDMRKLWGMLALEIVLGVVSIVIWPVKAW